jgi:RHS repeat-associated protein
MSEETTYQYDGAGNLIQKIDAKNQKTEYVYNDAGRLETVMYYSSDDHNNPVKTVNLTYDKVGNVKTYDDGTTSSGYFYDDLHRKTSENLNYGSFNLSYAYTYYKNSTKKSFTGPDGIPYEYTYGNSNKLSSVLIPGKGYITYNTYTWNRPENITLPGGGRKEYVYDPLMRVNSIKSKDPGQNIFIDYQYTYDKMDNIQTKETEHGDYSYMYDDLYRLTDVDSPVLNDEGFTYDGVGNRLTSEGVEGDWGYNNNNELLSYNGVLMDYDANGNMTQKNDNGIITNYFFNEENRLVRVEDGQGGVIAEYYYNPFGRRLWKDVGGTRTNFLYSDEGLVGEYDAGGVEIKTYGYKPGSTWTTDPLFMKQGSSYYYYHNDHLGTPQKLTAGNGAIVWSAKYNSFGKTTVEVETVENNLRFPGQYYDEETGLHYNYHRYYDSGVGRYLRADPIGFEGGINLYTYVLNNPNNFLDPEGLKVECINALVSAGLSISFISGECGAGILVCKDDCEERKCYSYKYCCGGGGIQVTSLIPSVSGVGAVEVGGWEGENISQFSGWSLQLAGAFAAGAKGGSGSVSIGIGGGWGVTVGPAGGLTAGGSVILCKTWGASEIPCVGSTF